MINIPSRQIEEFYFNKANDIKGSKSLSHYHNLLEIYYMKEGSCKYFIDDKSYLIRSGDLVMIPASVIHKTNYDSPTHARWLINCSEDYIPSTLLPIINNMPRLYKRSKLTEECEAIMAKIEREYSRQDEFSSEALKGFIYSLLFLLFRNSENQEQAVYSSPLIQRAVKYLKENLSGEITLNLTAEKFGVSAEHLSRTFKRQTGFCFSEYLNIIRLQKALNILKNEPGKSVNEVAFACGFNDSNYFSYKFTKAYGVSPRSIKKLKKTIKNR